MGLRFATRTDVGRRREANEDSFATDEVQGIFAVADGLGGHVAGRVASDIASARLVEVLAAAAEEERGRPLETLRRAFGAAHDAIVARTEREPELRGMGTTLVALWVRGGQAWLGHVGDSRIYLLRRRELYPLTFDHSLVAELVFRRQISATDARCHPHRSVITRALGVGVVREPRTAELKLEAGDSFLLCSDGVCGQLDDDEIRDLLLQANDDLDAAAAALIDLANERGGEDNATAVLVRR